MNLRGAILQIAFDIVLCNSVGIICVLNGAGRSLHYAFELMPLVIRGHVDVYRATLYKTTVPVDILYGCHMKLNEFGYSCEYFSVYIGTKVATAKHMKMHRLSEFLRNKTPLSSSYQLMPVSTGKVLSNLALLLFFTPPLILFGSVNTALALFL